MMIAVLRLWANSPRSVTNEILQNRICSSDPRPKIRLLLIVGACGQPLNRKKQRKNQRRSNKNPIS